LTYSNEEFINLLAVISFTSSYEDTVFYLTEILIIVERFNEAIICDLHLYSYALLLTGNTCEAVHFLSIYVI